jgi:hypothetical protein
MKTGLTMFNRANRLPEPLRHAARRTPIICLAIAALAGALAATEAGAAELPGPEEIFQRHVNAIGGAAALGKPRNMVFKGEADLVPLNVKAPIEFYVQAPDRFLFRLKYHYAFFGVLRVPFVGVRQPECGYDGTNGWTVDFDRRLEPMSANEVVSYRALLDKFSPLYASRRFLLTRTMGIERFANRDCYRVLVVLPSGDHAFEYYDTAAGLLAGTDYPFCDSGAWFNVRMTWSDFRRLRGGLRVPYRVDIEAFGDHYYLRGKEARTDDSGCVIPASKCTPAPGPSPILKPELKPAQAVIERYVEALGGREAIQSHASLHISGQLRFPRNKDFSSPIEIFSARTNRFFLQVQVPEGLHRQGCDGRRYWRATGTDVKFATGKDLEQLLAMHDFTAELHEPGGYRSMETLGTVKLGGKTCFQVLLVRKNGEVLDEFYDVETGLLHQRRRMDEANGGWLELLETCEGYRRFGNELIPARQVFTGLEHREELTITKVEWDNVPDTVFEPPSDLKVALDQKTSAQVR